MINLNLLYVKIQILPNFMVMQIKNFNQEPIFLLSQTFLILALLNVATSIEEKAELLNLTFHKVFKKDNGTDLKPNSRISSTSINDNGRCFNNALACSDVANSIHMISDKLSRSPDGIPANFLKRVFTPILNVLSYFFKLTLAQGN